ncbi:lysine acetyltransferase [Scheffersomyces xylosifermentans]|uniref:lysine acetyltransferase n=1 Tax=Scheffersomyces xylosifermentans TaxID=1304137 RepID=UPI00315D43D0
MPSTHSEADQYELVQLTDRDKITFTRLQNSQSWRGRLSADDYVVREAVLGKSKIASSKVNRLLVFMFKRKGDDTPLASIELLIRKGWKFDYENGEVVRHQVLTGCIGGVFTYPENRGKGYARIMVDKLVEIAKRDLLGPDGFTFLYSEVGEYYAKSGFKSFAVDLIHVPLKDHETIGVDEKLDDKFELIRYHQFEPYLDVYREQLNNEIVEKVKKDHKSRVTLTPTADIIDWFHLRSKYISYKMFHEQNDNERIDFANESYEQITSKFDSLSPRQFGLKLVNEKNELVGYIVWTFDWLSHEENYATVLKIVVLDGYDRDSFSIKLLKLLRQYLLKNDENEGQITNRIVLWESEIPSTVKNFLVEEWKSSSGIENGSRSAILLHDPSDNERLVEGSLIWEGNDKLSWF